MLPALSASPNTTLAAISIHAVVDRPIAMSEAPTITMLSPMRNDGGRRTGIRVMRAAITSAEAAETVSTRPVSKIVRMPESTANSGMNVRKPNLKKEPEEADRLQQHKPQVLELGREDAEGVTDGVPEGLAGRNVAPRQRRQRKCQYLRCEWGEPGDEYKRSTYGRAQGFTDFVGNRPMALTFDLIAADSRIGDQCHCQREDASKSCALDGTGKQQERKGVVPDDHHQAAETEHRETTSEHRTAPEPISQHSRRKSQQNARKEVGAGEQSDLGFGQS